MNEFQLELKKWFSNFLVLKFLHTVKNHWRPQRLLFSYISVYHIRREIWKKIHCSEKSGLILQVLQISLLFYFNVVGRVELFQCYVDFFQCFSLINCWLMFASSLHLLQNALLVKVYQENLASHEVISK